MLQALQLPRATATTRLGPISTRACPVLHGSHSVQGLRTRLMLEEGAQHCGRWRRGLGGQPCCASSPAVRRLTFWQHRGFALPRRTCPLGPSKRWSAALLGASRTRPGPPRGLRLTSLELGLLLPASKGIKGGRENQGKGQEQDLAGDEAIVKQAPKMQGIPPPVRAPPLPLKEVPRQA